MSEPSRPQPGDIISVEEAMKWEGLEVEALRRFKILKGYPELVEILRVLPPLLDWSGR